MGCTDALRHDHQGVVEAADTATGMAVTLVQGRRVPHEDLVALVAYARVYVHEVHHRREEEVLFPMVRSRLPQLSSECDRLQADHWRAARLIEEAASGAGGLARTGEVLAEWGRLVRAHTREEEAYLLPIVESSLRPDRCLQVRSGFSRIDRQGPDRIVESLLLRYLVPV